MKISWHISKAEADQISNFVRLHRRDPFVRRRKMRNVDGDRPPLTKSHVWRALTICLLTTRQRSGPGSAVHQFVRKKPFSVGLGLVQRAGNCRKFATDAIRAHGGIRRPESIGSELAANLKWFSGRDWSELRAQLTTVETGRGYWCERNVAEWLCTGFRGLGPKQSRNMLQVLGLSRYEIPIDSRITKWLNNFGFPVRLNATALSDPDYYSFVSDGIRVVCKAVRVYPCILDAAIFVSYDNGRWTEENVTGY